MLIPNTIGRLSRKTGHDGFAAATYATPRVVACAIVHLNGGAQKTSVRTDSSASRGNAEEEIAIAKILFPKTVAIGIEDKFEIVTAALRVMKIEPRYGVDGVLDHYEADMARWAQ